MLGCVLVKLDDKMRAIYVVMMLASLKPLAAV